MSTWEELSRLRAQRENERLEAQKLAHYQAERISDPLREMGETMRDIKSLLHELLEEIKRMQNDQ